MLFQIRNNRSVIARPQLSRAWIKTGNPKMPLQSVWVKQASLRNFGEQLCAAERQPESRELAEDHFAPAA